MNDNDIAYTKFKPQKKQILNHCPFCGGIGEYKTMTIGHTTSKSGTIYYGVECRECSANVGMFETKKEAAMEWNRRASDG